MAIQFLDLGSQYSSIKSEIDAAIEAVIRDGAFIGGAYVRDFETHFAEYQHVKHCIGVGNGTDAIEIALEALDLPKGSEVLVPANSFIASAEAVTRSGHKVVFCDCDPRTYTLSVADASKRITPKTKAVVAVHLYGHPVDMGGLGELSRKHGLKVVEDCAQAHGAEFNGRRVGSIGDIGTFSFYPGKNLGAYGDAGAIVTNDERLAKKCGMIANHGRVEKYDHEFEGRNSRLDGLQAAILDVKLKYLDVWIQRRREIAKKYQSVLKNVGDIVLPLQADWAAHAWHLFVIRTQKREQLKSFLAENGVQTGVHYPIALSKLKAYAYLGQATEAINANQIDRELLSLPMGDQLNDPDVLAVAELIRKFFGAAVIK